MGPAERNAQALVELELFHATWLIGLAALGLHLIRARCARRPISCDAKGMLGRRHSTVRSTTRSHHPNNNRTPTMTHPDHLSQQSAGTRARQEHVDAAHRYVQQLRAFYVHAAVFAVSMLSIVLVNLITNVAAGIADDWSAWWSVWALLGWSAGIAVHGLVVRLNRPTGSSSTWEQRQIDKVLRG